MTWLYLPSTCLPSAPELEGSNSASELPSPARVASLTWRGKPRRPQLWLRAWKRGGYIRLLSGLILPPSTLSRGVDSFIASLREIPASPTQKLAPCSAPTTTAGLPNRWSGSSKRCGRIVSSGKTSRGIPTDNSPLLSRHWKQWAIALRREYSARTKPAEAISGNGFSSWPTPAARDFRSPNSAESQQRRNADKARGQQLMNFVADLMRSTGSPFSLQAQRTRDGETSSPERRTLNPRFVDWLMALPVGWTSCEPVGTECSHWLRRMRGALSTLVSAPAAGHDRQIELAMELV